ncbi:citramalate synthase [bacterium]|nr:citramalate synthase [Candidatus Omnitrophota bacterium]MBU2529186.1 citramalate synthase [bacterium]MBU3930460.1 citramalate synthase [bacterium]MBU4122911.1 citramalate synthase [bacterium]
MTKVILFDTTLRDGTQAEGISLGIEDKINIAKALKKLGIHYIEGGWPGSNPKDAGFFKSMQKIALSPSKLVAFGSTRRKNIPASSDKNLIQLVKAKPDAFCIFGKTSLLHVKEALGTTPDENINMIKDSVKYLKKTGKEVIYDAEHFFDGYKENREYALSTLGAADAAGADWLCLCDTNGGSMPCEITDIMKAVRTRFPKSKFGIHAHNDCDLAVANSLMAVEAGAEMVQGTINGWGERCGNANLASVMANLVLKKGAGVKNITAKEIRKLTKVSRYIDEVANLIPKKEQPFVGRSAFAHKGGVHVSAVMKNAATYEHLRPESVGNERRILISDLSGQANLKAQGKQLDINLEDKENLNAVLKEIKLREAAGYQYEAASASLKLLVQKIEGRAPSFFDVKSCRVILEYGLDRKKCEASVKLMVKGKTVYEAAEGDGPVNALDNCLRKALLPFFPRVKDISLTDFKVRVLNPAEATAAAVRVFIESTDGVDRWTTTGVSEDVVEASWQALVESIVYKLLKR